MKKFRFWLFILGLLLLATACTAEEEITEAVATETGTEDNADTSNDDASDVLVMATNATFPPYEFYEGGEIVGIDAEVAAKIAEKLGKTLRIDDMEFGAIINAVTTGKADIGMAGMSVTEDRLESVDFSTSYATGIQSIIVKEDSDIAEPADSDERGDTVRGHLEAERRLRRDRAPIPRRHRRDRAGGLRSGGREDQREQD